MKKRKKIIILIVIIVVILLILAVYFLFINKTTANYFGFSIPDFAKTAVLGDIVGDAANANAWKDAKLNPFRNES